MGKITTTFLATCAAVSLWGAAISFSNFQSLKYDYKSRKYAREYHSEMYSNQAKAEEYKKLSEKYRSIADHYKDIAQTLYPFD